MQLFCFSLTVFLFRSWISGKCRGPYAWIINFLTLLIGPKYDGDYLHNLINDILGKTRLHQALTNIVIPTFDIKNLQPAIFSSYQVPV